MAIIKFINNKVSLKKTINYITKEEKTNNMLISGKDCTSENSYEEMMAVKNMYGKIGGREKLHFIQSFNPEDELTYEIAHEIAMKIADKFFKSFQVIVATHQDTKHIHSHFVVNSVNFETGKKIQFSQKDLERLKEYSNKLCMQYGLSVTQEKSKVDDIKINEYKAKQKGISWKEALEKTIDLAMEKSTNKHDFFKIMNSLGYKVTWTKERKNITYTTPSGYKCRDRKLHNEKYLKENMEQYFKEKSITQIKGVKKQQETQRYINISSSIASIIQQFRQNSQNEYGKNVISFNKSANKQYWMDKHYSLEQGEEIYEGEEME